MYWADVVGGARHPREESPCLPFVPACGARDKLYILVSQLKAEGVPIDGVGHQMHVNVDWPSAAETEAMIQKFVPLDVD